MVQPLTKRHLKTGELYTRRPEVEQQLESLLRLPTETRLARARNIDLKPPDSMSDEALLHLVRDAHRRGAEEERDALIRPLFIRCQSRLKRAMPDALFANAQKLRDEALSDFCDLMLSDGQGEIPDRLDYYEVHFADAFKKLRSTARRAQDRAFQRNTQLPEDADSDAEEPARADDVTRRAEELTKTPALQESTLNARDLERALKVLTPNERDAIVLQAMGYRIDSIKPKEATIAQKLGVTRRTIQNWLASAEAKLRAQAKEDQ
jgi:DNA-directed RNA polymerase specialized sigma24 family protein